MKDFAYACPAEIGDAVAALQADGARALAGGTDLILQMREGRRQVPRVVDLKKIPELTSISVHADGSLVSVPQPALRCGAPCCRRVDLPGASRSRLG